MSKPTAKAKYDTIAQILKCVNLIGYFRNTSTSITYTVQLTADEIEALQAIYKDYKSGTMIQATKAVQTGLFN